MVQPGGQCLKRWGERHRPLSGSSYCNHQLQFVHLVRALTAYGASAARPRESQHYEFKHYFTRISPWSQSAQFNKML
jgi:hypothetical protein